ncbi:MAG: hypothetical protein JSW43_02395, partial [Gemmatimonadota bacterium]
MNWAVDNHSASGSVWIASLDGVMGGLGSYLLVFAVAAACCALFVPLAGALGQRLGAMDDTRKPPVPRIGGVAIGLGAFTGLVLVGLVFVPTGLTLLATSRSIGPVLAGTLAILLLGVVDDMRPVPAWGKFAVQVGVAAAMYAVGVRVALLSLPFGPVDLGPALGFVVTVLWLVGI